MLNLDNLTDDMKKQPYNLNVQLLRLNLRTYVVRIVNFAHIQINSKKALGFSIDLHLKISENNDIDFNDDGNLLKAAIEAVRIVYRFQLHQTALKKINVIPIYTGGLVRYMNDSHSMFHYLKPVNRHNRIVQNFRTHGYLNLKKAIAEYAVMTLSIIHYAEITLRNQQLHNSKSKH